jgi:hypothetical protein
LAAGDTFVTGTPINRTVPSVAIPPTALARPKEMIRRDEQTLGAEPVGQSPPDHEEAGEQDCATDRTARVAADDWGRGMRPFSALPLL